MIAPLIRTLYSYIFRKFPELFSSFKTLLGFKDPSLPEQLPTNPSNAAFPSKERINEFAAELGKYNTHKHVTTHTETCTTHKDMHYTQDVLHTETCTTYKDMYYTQETCTTHRDIYHTEKHAVLFCGCHR